MKRAVIYTRVSTDKQEKEGYSLPEQERLCLAAIQSKEWEYVSTYSDTWSGATMDRPGLQELLTDLKSGLFDVVVIYKLDRLSRTQKDTMAIIEDFLCKHNVGLLSLSETLDTTTPFGKAMIGILSAFNQLERDNIRYRTMMGKQAKKEKGGFLGASMLTGYKYAGNDKVEIDEEKAEYVRMVFKMRNDGATLDKIARTANEKGMTGGNGGKPTALQVRNLLNNASAYALGEWHTCGIVMKVPKIVDIKDVPPSYMPVPVKQTERKLAELGIVMD